MRIRSLPTLAFATALIPLAVACGGTEEPSNNSGGAAGAGGSTGGTAGVGGATGGAGTTGTTGGTAGTVSAGGTAGTTSTGGTAGTGTAGTGGAAGGGAGGMAGTGTAGTGTAGTGTAGTGTAGTGGGGSMDSPADTSQAGLEAFIMAMSHRGQDWRANAEMPLDGTSVHARNRIWYNRTLRQSAADGKGGSGMPHATGSMVVKEIYTGENVIGHAAMLRLASSWIYYCVASEAGRCTSSSMPNQATYAMTASSCSCHGQGTIVTGEMIPDP